MYAIRNVSGPSSPVAFSRKALFFWAQRADEDEARSGPRAASTPGAAGGPGSHLPRSWRERNGVSENRRASKTSGGGSIGVISRSVSAWHQQHHAASKSETLAKRQMASQRNSSSKWRAHQRQSAGNRKYGIEANGGKMAAAAALANGGENKAWRSGENNRRENS